MKTFGKIIICVIVVLLAIGIAYLAYDGQNSNPIANQNTNTQNTNNKNKVNEKNTITNEISNNTEYIGEEENKEEPIEEEKQESNEPEEVVEELTGKDKAIDIVKKQYAVDGQTVRFDHMEGNNYIIKINDGTAVTWYLVDGTTWEAEEY